MLPIIMLNNFFNNLFNTLVRGVDEFWKGVLAFGFFALALYLLAKGFKVKDKGGSPFKVGYIVMAILCIGVTIIYTIY